MVSPGERLIEMKIAQIQASSKRGNWLINGLLEIVFPNRDSKVTNQNYLRPISLEAAVQLK